jgi:effector-binding domain-containing protein
MMPARRPDIAIREPRERLVASVRTRSHPSQLRQTIAGALDEVLDVIGAEGLAPAGPVFTRYHRIGPIAELEVGIPLAQTVRPHPRVLNSTLPGGPAVHAVCMGGRVKLVQTVRALYEYLKSAGLTASGGYWEYYLAEPIPGLDRSEMEFYLPIVGVHTNGRRRPLRLPVRRGLRSHAVRLASPPAIRMALAHPRRPERPLATRQAEWLWCRENHQRSRTTGPIEGL